jgi:GNAT superfamily N-acetyltransferase
VNDGPGWKYYARPTPGTRSVTREEVERLRARQRELGGPESIEWVEELVPSLGAAAEATGLSVHSHPLLCLDAARDARPSGDVEVRLVSPEEDIRLPQAVSNVGFKHPGTARGQAGIETVAATAASIPDEMVEFVRDRLRRELTVMAVATIDGAPVTAGGHQPVGESTEIVGVATLPAFRRRGLGAAVTSFLVRDALDRGVRLVLLSAGSEEIARVYRRLGFADVGRAGEAETPGAT